MANLSAIATPDVYRSALRLAVPLVSLFMVAAPTSAAPSASADSAGEPTCQPYKNTRPVCGFTRPEDIALLPGDVLVISEYGDMVGEKSGTLAFYDLQAGQRRVAFSSGDGEASDTLWGDAECTAPPAFFSPHGIDLSRRDDGRWQLLVVQHGGRESVEFFEVTAAGNGWSLQWRGCAEAPEGAKLNSVAAGPEGSFFATRMISTDANPMGDAGYSTEPTGYVYQWSHEQGYQPVPGTAGVLPNGIVSAPDGEVIYVGYSGEGLVKKIDPTTGELLAQAPVASPDNIKWSIDGQRITAASLQVGPQSGKEFGDCMQPGVTLCRIPFAIVELDPQTLDSKVLFEDPKAPMGAGTVGLKSGDALYIGSFAGNRMLIVDLSD